MLKKNVIPSLCLALIGGLWLNSCALFSPKRAGVARMGIDELQNGYLVRIVTEEPFGEAAAFIAPSNWLIVTIGDSTVQAEKVTTFRSSLVDSVEIAAFPTAVQISLHMRILVETVEVAHRNPSNEILISLRRREK